MAEYEEVMEMMEELRISMKKMKKHNKASFRTPEFHALLSILDKENISMQELGDEMGVTKPRVTALVNDLVSRELVEQTADESDKRKKLLRLTKKGKVYMENHRKEHRASFKGIWDKLNSNEQEMWKIVMSRVTQIIKEEIEEKKED